MQNTEARGATQYQFDIDIPATRQEGYSKLGKLPNTSFLCTPAELQPAASILDHARRGWLAGAAAQYLLAVEACR